MRTENLLIELGTEELPPKALSKLASSFASNMGEQLQNAELEHNGITWYASPRRLALHVEALAEQQQDKVIEKRGPAVSAAFDADGNPTKAAEGWARANGITVNQAERLVTDKGEWLLHKAQVTGQPISVLLAELVSNALKKLPIPKPMRWGNTDTQFIRPVHTLTFMYGGELLPGEVLGLTSGNTIQGHRFHGEKTFELDHADNYLKTLEKHYVLADFEARKNAIKAGLEKAADAESAKVDMDEALLDEVTALVEWPVVLTARFEDSFLDVPKEALIYTMKDDQKYFPLLDNEGNLKSRFLFVSNIESQEPIQVVRGNEKVIRPRLADAQFFFESDKKVSLEARLASLETVLFQKQLGSLKEKSARIANLAQDIAGRLGADATLAHRAGMLSKTDLMTNMVMEFPDVQGVMGMHYARHDGEDEAVAVALDEQYKPRFSGDALPAGDIGRAVALADKLDTLVGIFGIGQVPKGDKDPFALRRAAIGVLRIIVDAALPLDLEDLVSNAVSEFGNKLTDKDVQSKVVDFILARFRTWYQEQGVDVDVIQSVLARRPTQPADFNARVSGVRAFKALDSADALAAANKRVANILAKNPVSSTTSIDPSLFKDEEEAALYNAVVSTEQQIEPLLEAKDYTAILKALSGLREPIDAFFDNVMVMSENEAEKVNRLALLMHLRGLFLHCADISLLSQ